MFSNLKSSAFTTEFDTETSGLNSFTLTLDTGSEFIQGSELSAAMFTVSGLNGGVNSSGAAAATKINTSGVNVVRESDRVVRVYGDWGLTSGLHSGLITVTVDNSQFRVLSSSPTLTGAGSSQQGIAKVVSGTVITLTSGNVITQASGVTFTITLSGEKFDPTYEDWADMTQTDEWFNGSNIDIYSGVVAGTLNFSGLISDANSGLLTITVTGTVPTDTFVAEELEITIPAAALQNNSSSITVLTEPDDVILTTRPKIEIAIIK